ncbi:hypothetical protein C2E25_11350 [Geothermobacter hydrogeniphilus]|uniref:DUF4145 domain-containing protein n=1 Tax=Geothermobacter hydrogeniphilus TaxID=1969733 RepID=A0A2K2H8U8_9BACT|nr:DUF4145 domain-containing protein [Geothermobacter hydrogeniphilus]PNU19691.1 hypothetical protein C2E25_11350 [Geothermobacter hydrogeniphilus]
MNQSSTVLVNTTTIESATGLRSINLYHGDLCSAQDELIAISSHAGAGSSLTGMVVKSFAARFDINFSSFYPLLVLPGHPTVGTFQVPVEPTAENYPGKALFVVRIPGPAAIRDFSTEPLDVYDDVVWTLFGSLAALEQKDVVFSSLALPLLAGRRGYPGQKIMEILLKRATTWLKTSRNMKDVNFYLYEESSLGNWNEAMNQALGRKAIDSAKGSVVQALREEILVLLKGCSKFNQGEMAAHIAPLLTALQDKKIYLQLVSTLGRKLVETMVRELISERSLEDKGLLVHNITMLNYEQVVAPWIASHFHALRVFGNEAVHAKNEVKYKPKELREEDLVAVLTSLRSVVQFYAEW